MKTTKRFLMLLLAVCLCFGLMTVTASAAGTASGSCGDNLSWSLSNGTLTISGTGAMTDYNWGSMPWYEQCSSIKSVVIKSGVTTIGAYAFYDCTNLTKVTIPDSVTAIGNDAFNSTSLKSITVPNSVTEIGSYAFAGCNSLTEVTVPASVTSLGGSLFYNCDSLVTATILGPVETLESSMFESCEKLETVTLPEGLKTLSWDVFYYCTALKTVNIPSTVTEIQEFAFCGCKSLESITIPASVEYIGEDAFRNCTGLKKITVASGNANYSSDSKGVLFNKAKTVLILAPAGLSGSYTVPKTVTEIQSAAFDNCTGLTKVTLPDGITYIGYVAFSGCSGLTSVNIPASLTTIEGSTFWGCESLKSVTIPSSVTTINGYAFAYCGLESVTIPASVTWLGDGAFAGCPALKKITVASGNPNYSSDSSGILYNKDKTVLKQVPGTMSGSYTIPSTVTEIDWSAFAGCNSLTSVTIPGGVAVAPALSGLTGLKTITMKEGVEIIDWGVFQNCPSLETVTIPASVFSIGWNSFDQCPKLSTIKVASGSKNYCTDENGILYTKDKSEILFVPMSLSGDFTIPSTVTNIYEAFAGSQISSITIPGTVTDMSGWTFKGCTKLKSVTVGSGVTQLAYEAFRDCTSLTSVELPDTLTAIGYGMFSNCASLKSIVVPEGVTTVDFYWGVEGSTPKNMVFTGNAPKFDSAAFADAKVTVWYPYGNTTWTKSVRQNYGGTISWVSYKPLGIKTQPVVQKVKNGATAKFTVAASGPALSYQWQYRTSANGVWKNATATGNKTATLKVPATTAKSGYQYRCKVTDAMGNTVTTKTTYLYVLGIKTQPTAKNVKVGTTAKFTVSAAGHNKTYQWQYKNAKGNWVNATATGAKTATLSVKASTSLNGRLYRCVIKDSKGNQVITNAVKLTVFGIKTQPTAKSVKAGTTAKFSVTATGSGLKYQWQYKNANGNWVNTTATGAKTATLKVTAKASFSGRQYRCKITDSLGRVIYTNIVKLTVK